MTEPTCPPHRYIVASQAEGGAFDARCKRCGARKLLPQVPETIFNKGGMHYLRRTKERREVHLSDTLADDRRAYFIKRQGQGEARA